MRASTPGTVIALFSGWTIPGGIIPGNRGAQINKYTMFPAQEYGGFSGHMVSSLFLLTARH